MILVTGGAGYIGSHCVRELLSQGYEVSVVDNLQTGHRDAVDPRAKFFRGDIRDKVFLDRVFDAIHPEAAITLQPSLSSASPCSSRWHTTTTTSTVLKRF